MFKEFVAIASAPNLKFKLLGRHHIATFAAPPSVSTGRQDILAAHAVST
jgi:hypothetical protein